MHRARAGTLILLYFVAQPAIHVIQVQQDQAMRMTEMLDVLLTVVMVTSYTIVSVKALTLHQDKSLVMRQVETSLRTN